MSLRSSKLVLLLATVGTPAWAAAPKAVLSANSPCTSSEQWRFAGQVPARFEQNFNAYLGGQISLMEGLAQARKLRLDAEDTTQETFAQYWLGHAFWRAGLLPLAYESFSAIVQSESDSEVLQIQSAAMSCLLAIGHDFGARHLPTASIDLIKELPASELRSRAAYRWFLESEDLPRGIKWMTENSQYRLAAEAYQLIEKTKWKEASDKLEKFFLTSRPSDLKSQEDLWRVMAGRMQYTLRNYKESQKHYALVNKSSNDFASSLSELGWAQLRDEQYNAAIGTALSLQTGWLQNTYSPEALMVMAMAFNETCHYPEALRAIDLFRRQHHEVVEWLKIPGNMARTDLYKKAISALKKDRTIPYTLAGEWIRSPSFLERQEEINTLLKQDNLHTDLEAKAKVRQKQWVHDLIKYVVGLKKTIQLFYKVNPNVDILPPEIQAQLDHLKYQLEDYDNLRRLAPAWAAMKKQNLNMAKLRRTQLVNEIEVRIETLNKKIYTQMADLLDNLKFIEVEIYQGATKDMIQTHANPNFEKKLADLKKKNGWGLSSKELRWGELSTGSLQKTEIWEDELGGFKADLPDRCEKKSFVKNQ